MSKFISLFIVVTHLLFLPIPAFASCLLKSSGETKQAGALIYNKTWQSLQVCLSDGTWKAVSAYNKNPCETGEIGAPCGDGSFYMGTHNGHRLYAAPADEPEGLQWKTSNTATAGTGDYDDGLANTYPALNNVTHPAGYACANKHPAGTWYLPSRAEISLFWTNRNQIDLEARGFDVNETFYWSSSELNAFNTHVYRFPAGGDYNGYGKENYYRVRCIRR